MNVRRVVTGHDDAGKSVFVSDEMVSSAPPGDGGVHRLWGGDAAPHFPDDGTRPTYTSFFPPIGGFRFGFFTVLPKSAYAANANREPAAVAERTATIEASVPGLLSYMEPDGKGMHTTPTIDFEVVLSGEVVLELDDSATVTLAQGDTVVQNGTRHRWRNVGDVPAVVAAFICGAQHDRVI
jgi:quercetin dioxygenase-like cupin family protein